MSDTDKLREVIGGVAAKLMGKPKEAGLKMFDEVVAANLENNRKLESCCFHDFAAQTPEMAKRRKWMCTKCGGEIDNHGKFWYGKGILHESLRDK